jgi:hypothetical protein
MWVPAALDSAVMAVYFTNCMESSLISKENSMEMFVICIIKFTI